MTTRIINDPGRPTLPRTWADWMLDLAVGMLIVVGAMLLVSSLTAAASTTPNTNISGAPVATPAPTVYRECPFCGRLYPGRPDATHTKFLFNDHVFISMPVTETIQFQTCQWIYYKHIVEAMETMRKVGTGRFVEVPKGKP